MKNIIIKGEFTDLNTYINKERYSRFAAAKIKSDETERVYWECKALGIRLLKPALILFEWYSKNKRKDKDNISFAKKFIIDGMVKAGVLKDDGYDDIIGFLDVFYIDKNEPRVEISFYEDPDKIKIENLIDFSHK